MMERLSIHGTVEKSENLAPAASDVQSVKPPNINRPILSPKSLNNQQSISSSQEQKKKRHWFQRLRMPFFSRAVEEDELLRLLRSAQSVAEFSCIDQYRTDVDDTFERFGFTKTPQWDELEGIDLPFFAPLHELDDESLEVLRRQVFGVPLLSDSDSSSEIFIEEIELSECISTTNKITDEGSPVIDEASNPILKAVRIKSSSLILSDLLSSSIQSSKDLVLDAKNGESEQHGCGSLPASSVYSPMVNDSALCTCESKVDDVSSPVHLYSGISDLLLSPSRRLEEQYTEEREPEFIPKRLESCPTHETKGFELDYPLKFKSLVSEF